MSQIYGKQLKSPLEVTASWAQSASIAITASYAMNGGGSGVSYITQSGPFSLTGIEVADYSNDVAVTFVNNTLKFIFGTPTVPSTPTLTFNSTFTTDRFNRVLDAYDVSGSFSVNGYTLISASLFTGSVLLAQTGTGETLITQLSTSGSQSYRLEVTSSSPLDNSIVVVSASLSGTLNKTLPGNPTITPTATVQLGASSNQIEQGATGSISFTTASGASNSWVFNSLTSSVASPIFVTGSATGSTSIVIRATASYSSSGVNGSDNNPALVTSSFATTTYSKIRSVRYGASISSSFTQAQLEKIDGWDTTLGGNIGTIAKGTVNPYGYQFTAVTNAQRIYIVIDSAYALTGILNVNNSFSNDINVFGTTVVGNYRIYSSSLSTTSILYELRT